MTGLRKPTTFLVAAAAVVGVSRSCCIRREAAAFHPHQHQYQYRHHSNSPSSYTARDCTVNAVPFHTPASSTTAFYATRHDDDTSELCAMYTTKLSSASGKPVCRYALGGAARSVQPQSLPLAYRDMILNLDRRDDGVPSTSNVAPFYFYYNPNRYPAFLSGVRDAFANNVDHSISGRGTRQQLDRRDIFIASGGTDRSPSGLDQRFEDALVHSGGQYLDAFVLEYVCPEELASDNHSLGLELQCAIEHVHTMKELGKVRNVMASTHSHVVGSILASSKIMAADRNLGDGSSTTIPAFDALMLRYNMAHRNAAEMLSLPAAFDNGIPVVAFTTTRWNRLQGDDSPVAGGDASGGAAVIPSHLPHRCPTTADCIKFALHHPAVETVLHSARDEEELMEALLPLITKSTLSVSGKEAANWLSSDDWTHWCAYGGDEMAWNAGDGFDEHPEEFNSMQFI